MRLTRLSQFYHRHGQFPCDVAPVTGSRFSMRASNRAPRTGLRVSDLRRLCGDPLSALEDPAPAV